VTNTAEGRGARTGAGWPILRPPCALASKMLAHIYSLTAPVEELTGEIQSQMALFQPIGKRLRTIPGVSDRLAEIVIAKTGADMTPFPTRQQLASWGGHVSGYQQVGW
jgi:transposase